MLTRNTKPEKRERKHQVEAEIFDRLRREVLTKNLTLNKDLKNRRAKVIWISQWSLPGRGRSRCKGPGAGACLVSSRYSKGSQ